MDKGEREKKEMNEGMINTMNKPAGASTENAESSHAPACKYVSVFVSAHQEMGRIRVHHCHCLVLVGSGA